MDMFLRFLFDTYIPFYADKLDKKVYSHEIKTDSTKILSISYLVFGFLLKALTCVNKKNQPLMIVQWKERLFKWIQFSEFIKRNLVHIKISGFIVAESLLSYTGEKLPTFVDTLEDLSFTLTESNSSVAEKILSFDQSDDQSEWEIPDTYTTYLAKIILGFNINDELMNKNVLQKNYKRLKNVYSHYTGRNDIFLRDENVLKSLYIRYKFHKEFSRIHKALLIK